MIHNLYVEVEPIIMKFYLRGIHVFYFCGGRGIGKTYGALDFCRKIGTGVVKFGDNASKFLYLRRSAVEIESVATPEANPFKKYNEEEGFDIKADYTSKTGFGNFYINEVDHIGYCAALSTFSNLRGVDFSDVCLILFDECIPENKRKAAHIKNEGILLLNVLETINRNRALLGEAEIVLVMLSNPIDLSSELLSQMNLTQTINHMIFSGREKYTDVFRSFHIEKYKDHPVSKLKAEKSMLYRFSKGTDFYDEALSGDFVNANLDCISKEDLRNYTPYLVIENVCIYKHKAKELFYISQKVLPCKYRIKAYEKEKLRKLFYFKYKLLILDNLVLFDNYQTKVVFEAMINYKPLL